MPSRLHVRQHEVLHLLQVSRHNFVLSQRMKITKTGMGHSCFHGLHPFVWCATLHLFKDVEKAGVLEPAHFREGDESQLCIGWVESDALEVLNAVSVDIVEVGCLEIVVEHLRQCCSIGTRMLG